MQRFADNNSGSVLGKFFMMISFSARLLQVYSPEKINGKKHFSIESHFTYVGTIRIPLKEPNVFADAEPPV